jgi:O-antigen ligase
MLLALGIAIGIALHRSKLKFRRLFESQEKLLILFLGLMWFSILLSEVADSTYSNTLKLTKVIAIVLMASHVITDFKRYEMLLWTFIIMGCYLGYQAYNAPAWMFTNARLNIGVGGADFAEANFLGAHFAMLIPFMGIMFLKSTWKAKVVCVISGVLVVNGLILIRSRGVFVALLIGAAAALVFSKGVDKRKLFTGMVAAMIGFFLLTDTNFWIRISTLKAPISQMDVASTGRIEGWKAAMEMAWDHPLGVGEGNFKNYADQYLPGMAGWDVHNTFLRCLTELGMQGLLVFLLLVFNAFRTLSSVEKTAEPLANKESVQLHIFAIRIGLIIYLIAGFFISLTYIEELYWLLIFPVFLTRSVENELP